MNIIQSICRALDPHTEGAGGFRRFFLWTLNLLALTAWGLGLGAVGLYFAADGVIHGDALLQSYLQQPLLLILNIAPCLALTYFFYLLFGRPWAGMLFSGVIVICGSLVNYYKIMLRGDPLLAADLTLFSEAAKMTGQYDIRITLSVAVTAALALAAVMMSVLLLRAKVRPWWFRLLLLAALCGLMYFGVDRFYFDDWLYEQTENVEVNQWFLSHWSDRDQFVSRGFVYPFIYSAKNAWEKPPEGYNKDEARALLQRYEADGIPEEKRVNVIAIMLEAYSDLSVYESIEFEKDPYDYFHQLQEESLSGRLVTNIFAGGTIDTERSFITGYTYMSEYRGATPSYADYFAAQGYTVEGGHPGYEWFYNRNNVNRWFGFPTYYFYENRYRTEGEFLMADRDFFGDILSLYHANRSTGRPYFNFSVTYQNHGPYSDKSFTDPYTVYMRNGDTLSTPAYRILSNYFEGIDRTDTAMELLIERLRREEEPVVVVLFGDHKPWLGDGSYVYSELGINLSLAEAEGFYNHYSTPYIIWANDAAKDVTGSDFQGDGVDVSPNFLMNLLFEECGWKGSSFFKATEDLFETLDIVNRSGLVRLRATGELTSWPTGEAAQKLSDFKKIEYYMKKDFKK